MERVAGERAAVQGGLPEDLDAWLAASEAGVPDLRPQAAKTVVWADARSRAATALALVYLHGFSADRHEVDPLPSILAERLGANTYYARLAGHGRDGRAMAEATVPDWLADTEEAMRIGERLGRRIVLMGTSTGGSLAVWAAAQPGWREKVAALVLISPNFGLRHPAARFLDWPGGALVVRLLVGKERRFVPQNERQGRHWTVCYPSSAILAMTALVRAVRGLPPRSVAAPVFVAYSELDRIVDPAAMRACLERLGAGVVRRHEVMGDGDANHHVLAGSILSPSTTRPLAREIFEFLEGLP